MANVEAVHLVGQSLVTSLRNAYPEPYRTDIPCTFDLLSSGELANETEIATPTLSLYLYRITHNEHLRNSRARTATGEPAGAVSLDLHFLLTVWADNARDEQIVLTWAVHELHQHPVLDVSSLSPAGGWGPGDFVQLIPSELTTEDLMRVWDALSPSYRLSLSYIARTVRIDVPELVGPAVVATRFRYSDSVVSS
jgi:hypothetical protein